MQNHVRCFKAQSCCFCIFFNVSRDRLTWKHHLVFLCYSTNISDPWASLRITTVAQKIDTNWKNPQPRVHLSVSFQVNIAPTVYLYVCGRPAFQLWKNPTPPATSVSLQRSQLGRKNAARRGWSTPDALDLLGELKHKYPVNAWK